MQRAEIAPVYHFAPTREANYLPREISLMEMLQTNPVYKRIVDITVNRVQHRLPENWSELPKTGFWMQAQMHTLDRKLQRQDMDSRTAFGNWVKETEMEVQAYTLEYLLRGKCIFPDSYEIINHNGEKTLRSTRTGQLIDDIILEQERNGVLKKSINAFKEFMIDPKTSDGSMCVIDSVSGPSALFVNDKNEIVSKEEGGKEIIFPDDQCYIFQKKGNMIQGFSVRTDADHKKASDFLKKLDNKDISPYAAPEEFVSQVCTFRGDDPTHHIHNAIDVLSIMQQAHGSTYAYTDIKRNIFTDWKDLYTDVQREDLYDFNDIVKQYIQDFTRFAWQVYGFDSLTEVVDGVIQVRNNIRDVLQKGLAATILAITSYLYKDDIEVLARRGETISHIDQGYGAAYKVMVAAGGCSSTGEKENIGNFFGEKFIDFGSPRFALFGDNESLTFLCPNCRWPHKRKDKNDWVYNCVNCHADVSCGKQKPSASKKEDKEHELQPVQKTRRKN